MTDPEMADRTYIEPITPEVIERIIEAEKPDAVLATLGGQTALNAAMALHERGSFARLGVKLIGADVAAIKRGENRELFKEIVIKSGGENAKSIICHSMDECKLAVKSLNYPVVVRPSFTMGGLGSGIAFNESLVRVCDIHQQLKFY
jgi:carbamoyl-phosphate synthase large subunit